MNVIETINKKLPEINKEIAFFDVLLYIHPTKEDLDCLDCVKECFRKILLNISYYKNEDRIYNRIDNDYQTLNDLFDELKDYVYPVVPFKITMLLSTLNCDDLTTVLEDLKKHEPITFDLLKKKVSKLYFKCNDNYPSFSDNTTLEEVSTYIAAINRYMKEKELDVKDEYLHILTDYIRLYLKGSSCTNI